jgi:hypothetical protein
MPTVQLNLRIDKALADRLRRAAKAPWVSMGSFPNTLDHVVFLSLLSYIGAFHALTQAPVRAQLGIICYGRQGYQRLTNWSSGLTGHGGYYETEICGRLLAKENGQAEFVVEVFGKEGPGSDIFSMYCSNKPEGYWKSNIVYVAQKRLSAALLKASKIYC